MSNKDVERFVANNNQWPIIMDGNVLIDPDFVSSDIDTTNCDCDCVGNPMRKLSFMELAKFCMDNNYLVAQNEDGALVLGIPKEVFNIIKDSVPTDFKATPGNEQNINVCNRLDPKYREKLYNSINNTKSYVSESEPIIGAYAMENVLSNFPRDMKDEFAGDGYLSSNDDVPEQIKKIASNHVNKTFPHLIDSAISMAANVPPDLNNVSYWMRAQDDAFVDQMCSNFEAALYQICNTMVQAYDTQLRSLMEYNTQRHVAMMHDNRVELCRIIDKQ